MENMNNNQSKITVNDDAYYVLLEEAIQILLPLNLRTFEEMIGNIIDVKKVLHGIDHQIIIHNVELRCNGLEIAAIENVL